MATLLDDHVRRALEGSQDRDPALLPAIEKEILHHDILRELHEHGFLSGLVFFGGTNLRLCHGSSRLSEDLDFKGGPEFDPASMRGMAAVIEAAFLRRYKLEASVEEPKPKEGNTRTWTIRIVTRPGSKSERQQRINLDVCGLLAYEHGPRVLANHYALDLGTRGLIIRSQSARETLTDKVLAIALRNRLQPRDLWDFAWLRQDPANRVPVMLKAKLVEHGIGASGFAERLAARIMEMDSEACRRLFTGELTRFLSAPLLASIQDPAFWEYLRIAVREDGAVFAQDLAGGKASAGWKM